MMTEQEYAQIDKAKVIVNEITNYVNTFNRSPDIFNNQMSREHRTLQQNFTRLCLAWLEHAASDEYRYDPRNEGSHKVAKQLMNGFKELQEKEGFTGETLELMSKPSGHLSSI